ncbi:MAG: hypothetical protein HY779_04020 [Rubrobacteridae bacterium]|nr:hypothetical protein [Rubrobacteridae bacterium]
METGKTDTLSKQKRLFNLLLIVAIISTIISLATAWAEIGRLEKPKLALPNTKVKLNKQTTSLEPPTPVIDLLPESILQYETRGRQAIPGSRYPAAESIYENLDPNSMLQNPINTYAKAMYFASSSDARLNIDNSIKSRFSYSNTTELMGSTFIKTGYDSRSGSYYVGWNDENYSIELITSFLDSIPVEKGVKLRNHALPLARSIIIGTGRGGPNE